MKISVIIACRNEINFIAKTLDSLVNQEGVMGDYEIIVVDGMSEDGTREIIDNYSSNYPNIRIINNEKKITPVAFNLGIKAAYGNYICILGAHAVYSKNYLSESLKLFSKHPEVVCIGGPIISKGESNFSSAVALVMSSMIGVGNAKHRFPEYEGYAEMACFPMFNRRVFSEIGLYDETLVKNQDDDFCFRINKKGEKIFISPSIKALYYVRNNPKSLFKQYFNYGVWRIAVTRKHKTPIALRQLIPGLFILTIVLLIITGLILKNILLMVVLPTIYLLFIIGFSIKKLKNHPLSTAIFIPIAIIILHFSYGIGFYFGINKFWKNKYE